MKEDEPTETQTWDISIRDKIMDLGYRVETDKKGLFLAHELLGERIIPEHRRPVATLEALLDLVRMEVEAEPELDAIEEVIAEDVVITRDAGDATDLTVDEKSGIESVVRKALNKVTAPKENLMLDPKLRSETAGEKSFLHSVKTPVTDKEMLIYTDELTTLDTKEKEILATFESQKAAYKSEQSKIDDGKNHLMHLLKTKEEWKDLECVNEFNYNDGTCEVIRKDTGELVQTRKMNADEFRRALPLKAVETEDAAATA